MTLYSDCQQFVILSIHYWRARKNQYVVTTVSAVTEPRNMAVVGDDLRGNVEDGSGEGLLKSKVIIYGRKHVHYTILKKCPINAIRIA